MKTTTRMTMRMRTMSPRAAAPAPLPRGTPRTLTPTEAQPHPGLPSPTDRLCFSPMFCPLPPGLPHFLSFSSFFLNKIRWGEGLEEPRPGLCSLRDTSPGGPSRERNHQTEPPLDRPGPPLFCTCGSGMDNGPGSGVGGPKEFSEALYTCSPTHGRVEAWGGSLPSQRGLLPGPLHWNWRQGKDGERRVGACEKTVRKQALPAALSPAPCRKELPGPAHGGRGQKCFLYMCIYFFF